MKLKKAFTLIELLVVIAIIGTLAAVLVPNYIAARQHARDTQRKSDLHQFQKAFELYRQDNNSFPTAVGTALSYGCGTSITVSGTTYMSKVPCDPLNVTPTPYYYKVDNTTLTYTLCACLENVSDLDGVSNANCLVQCPGITGCSSPNKCYIVNNP